MVQTHDASIHWSMFKLLSHRIDYRYAVSKVLRKSTELRKHNVYSRFWYWGEKLSTKYLFHVLWKFSLVHSSFSFERGRFVFVLKHFSDLWLNFAVSSSTVFVWCQWHEVELLLPDCRWSQCPKIEMVFVARRLVCESHRQVEKHVFGSNAIK